MDVKIFDESVIGFKHKKNNKISEDFSGSFMPENQQYAIVAVADGHGDIRCCRSHIGSKLAIEVVLEQFQKFSEKLNLNSEISMSDLGEKLYSIFSNNIVKGWKMRCLQHYRENPISEEEQEQFGKSFSTEYEPILLYGTTLIAALRYADELVIVQQGDGDVVMLYDDGRMDTPISLDTRCYKNVTTSLCDLDAESSYSMTLFNVRESKIAACFLATDGVKNSFDTIENMFKFYSWMSIKLLKGQKQWSEDLAHLSLKGSHDDISIAGIYDQEKLEVWVQKKRQEYERLKTDWDAKNRKAKIDYMDSIQVLLDEKKEILNVLNSRLKELKVKKPDKLKYILDEVMNDLSRLEEENNKRVSFDGKRGLLAKDRRKFLYEKIRTNMESHFDFSFEEYDVFFNRFIDYDFESYVKVNEFIERVKSYISTVHVEEFVLDDTNELRNKMMDKKKKIQSECANLKKDLESYQSSQEYRQFKNEYNWFMKICKE